MHVVVADDESYNKKIKQRKNRDFFFMVEFSMVNMTTLRMYHFDANLQEMTKLSLQISKGRESQEDRIAIQKNM